MSHPVIFHRLRAGTWIGWQAPPDNSNSTQVQINGKNYNWINVLAGGETGNAAVASLAKAGGPNQYTYFLGFGEDAVSYFVNRAFFALAENTDLLDSELNQDQPVHFMGSFTLADPANNVEFGYSDIFLGPVGTALNSATLPKYFRLLNSAYDEVIDNSTNQTVQVQAITGVPTSPDPPYMADVPFVFSHTLPAGTYYVVCGQRSALSTLHRGDLLPHNMVSAARTPGVIQTVLRALRGDSLGYLSSWDATVYALARRGLNGAYNNTSITPAVPSGMSAYGYSTDKDTAGAGGAFLREGPSVQGLSRRHLASNSPYTDLLGALYTATLQDDDMGDGVGAGEFVSGSRGFVSVGQRIRSLNNGSTASTPAPGLHHFAAFTAFPDKRSTTTSTPTVLNVPVGVTLQRVSGEDRVTLTTSGNWFTKTISAVNRTSLVLGWSLLEIEWVDPSDPLAPNTTVRRVYRVMSLPTSTRALVCAVDGSASPLPAVVRVGTLVRVLTPTFGVLDGLGELQDKLAHPSAALFEHGSMVCVSLPQSTDDTADQVLAGDGAYFGASNNAGTYAALRWGGYRLDLGASGGKYIVHAKLLGDGSINCRDITCQAITAADDCHFDLLFANAISVVGDVQCSDIDANDITCLNIYCSGTINGSVAATAMKMVTATKVCSTPGSQILNLTSDFASASHVYVRMTASPVTFNSIGLPTFASGTVFQITFFEDGGAGQIESGAWSSDVLFESPEDGLLSGVTGSIDTYKGLVLPSGKILMSVQRYSTL